jgi:hypothetical protein
LPKPCKSLAWDSGAKKHSASANRGLNFNGPQR